MPVVLLHGFLGDAGFWRPLCSHPTAPAPVRQGLALDLLGHAGAPDDAASFDEELERIARVLANRGPWHAIGYSLGGRLALGLLARFPALVNRATVIGAHPGLSDEAAKEERRRDDEVWAGRILSDYPRFLTTWEAQALFAGERSLPAAVLSDRRAARLRQEPARLVHALRVLSLGAMPSWWDDLAALDRARSHDGVWLDFVAGERDEKFLALGRELVTRCGGARLTVAPGVGHNVVLEALDWFAGFLAQTL